MTATACPTCGKPVDPLRAPAVGVRDGRVVGFCSKECVAEAVTAPIPRNPPRAVSQAGVAAKLKKTPPTGVPKSMADLDSGPVIEIVHEPASGVVTSSADARVSNSGAASSRRAETDGAIQIADTGHVDDYIEPDEPRRGRGTLVFLLFVLVLAAAGAAAYHFGYLDRFLDRDRASAATPAARPVAPVEPPAAPAPPPVAPAEALDRARAVLRAELKPDVPPRMQRLAATALSRTGDAQAIAWLAGALAKEQSAITQLDIAYALARAGDKRGTDALVAALGSPRRDVKGEAARRLALLGDTRATPTLDEFLEYSQFRLGAAESLAHLADPKALDILDKLRADPKAIADDRAAAAIALGTAGRTDVADSLRELLADARFNAFAATALAGLHDPSARPVLVKQLAIPSLRVGAARALRELDPKLDPVPLLAPLVAALASTKDTEQVQAAEAILVLAGPPAWSARE
ncbi:MAG TPA: HEAT repeat domain-containing protein [Kofleriaceae bacterium]|nr:HEAT repeat domain-containing protein [Kofleriaceae bacterium]